MRTLYSCGPILTEPDGSIRFCALTALETSAGESFQACSRRGSMSTMICRTFPPYGQGSLAPATVAMPGRSVLMARSYISCSVSVSLPSEACTIGTLAAL